MKIIKLILHKYKRLFLNEIDHLEYTPDSKTQIILGQNGSGKSSLLRQLTPLAANVKKDFNQGGYKEITISHENKTYVLINGVNGTTKHSFLVDNIEHNDSGTFKVQNRLVELHFNITPHLHQVILGENKFTQMSPTERKKWLTTISNIDYTYPITVFNSLKSRHRDIVGGIKLTQNDLVKYEDSNITKDHANRLAKDKEHYTVIIDHLLSLTNTIEQTDNISEIVADVSTLVKRIDAQDKYTVDDIKRLNDSIVSDSAKRDMYRSKLSELNKKLENITNIDIVRDKETIINAIDKLNKEISIITSTNAFSGLENISSIYTYLNDNYSDIISSLAPLGKYSKVKIEKDHIRYLKSELNQHETLIAAATKRLHKFEEHLKHLKKHLKEDNEVQCPECLHVWLPGVNAKEVHTIETEVKRNTRRLRELEGTYRRLNRDLEKIEDVRVAITNFTRYFSYNNDGKFILNYIRNTDSYNNDGYKALFSLFERVYIELSDLYPVADMKTKVSELSAKLVLINEKEKFVETIYNSKESLEKEVLTTQGEIYRITNDINSANNHLNKAKTYLQLVDDLKDKLKTVYKTKKAVLEDTKNKELKKAIFELRMDVAEIDEQLKSYNQYDAKLRSYQAKLDELTKKEKVLRLLCEELSPSSGLIAKSIESFINSFVSDMNYLINSVWGYDMEIIGCDIEGSNLDYKFKVLVNNEEVIEDISKTSSGMKEIIDLIFVVTFSKYAGFIDYPILLDEFGKTLDAHHRITAYETLERKIAKDFSQVFIVSHFESMYGRFGTADVSILGTTGVDINTIDDYNRVLTIS